MRTRRDLAAGFRQAVSPEPGRMDAARIRVARTLGAPALAALGLVAIGSAMLIALGVVAGDALGLTPLVYAAAAIFFVITAMTYVEGNSVHPERGGASMFARYAFDELWSFVAGWALLLDYLIVMAAGAFAVSHYLNPFWADAGDFPWELMIAGAVIGWVAWSNIRGISARGLQGRVLRLGIVNLVVMLVVVVVGLTTEFHPGDVVDSVELGDTPQWDDLGFALVVATLATVGIESASGLAGEIRASGRGLTHLVVWAVFAVIVLMVGVSAVGIMAVPVDGGSTDLAGKYIDAPVLGIVSSYDAGWLRDALRAAVGLSGALLLVQAVRGTMLGLSRLTYSLATNRQVPSLVGRLHPGRSTPYVAVSIAAVMAFGLACSSDVEFLLGIFAFGAMVAFTIAHLSVIVLRFREPQAQRAFRVPLSIPVGGGSIPLPAALGAIGGLAAWVSVLFLHSGARYVGGAWMVAGLALYTVYRKTQGKALRKRFTIPERALQEAAEIEYGSILVPVFGTPLDDDIVGTAGRLAGEESEDGEGGAVIEALYVVEVPMSLPLDARVPDEQIAAAKRAVARAKEVGEEYEGVVVATAMVRARSSGAAIVSEAKRRGVEAIVLAAEAPTRIRGGGRLGGRGGPRDRSLGETTRYVVEKAPCRVILTAAPAGEEGEREGVAP